MPGSVLSADAGRRDLRHPEVLRELVLRLQEGIYVATRGGVLVDGNPALSKILGVPLDELPGCCLEDFLVDAEASAAAGDESVQREIKVRRRNGEVRTVVDSVSSAGAGVDEGLLYGSMVDVTERKRMETRLRELSVRDSLTGCYNRRYLSRLADRFGREESWGAVFVSADELRAYSDRYGRSQSDEVLMRVSRFLLQQVRADDVVLRLGGDEFLIIISGRHAASTDAVAERLAEAARRSAPFPFSYGWARRAKGESLDETIARADRNLTQVRLKTKRPADRRRT